MMAIASRNKGLVESVGSHSPFYLDVCLKNNSDEITNSILNTVVQGLKLPGVMGTTGGNEYQLVFNHSLSVSHRD